MKTKITALALLMLAGTAAAQPASFTDLGNRTSTQNFTQDVMITSPTDIQWFRIELPAVSAVAGFVDIWTNAVGDMTDTEIGLYDAAGNGAGSAATFFDDDSGPGLFSQLTFGSTVERPNLGGAAARNGSDGSLAGGVYYLAVGRFNVNWAEGFGATGTYAGTQTTTQVQFDIGVATDPFPPQATAGTATPGSVTPGDSILYTVTVIPGGNPVSTGIVVTGDLSSLGGSGTAAFHDDGLNGDAAAGDGVYSLMYTVPAATAGGGYTVPVSVSDAQGRTASTSIATGVMNPANLGTISADQTFTTVVPPAFGQWYQFTTTADATVAANRYFDIDTNGSAIDTEIAVYRMDGTLVATNDDGGDGLDSVLSFGSGGGPVTEDGGSASDGIHGDLLAGTYLLVVSQFNSIFADGPNVTYPPAGAGGDVTVTFTTGIFVPPPPPWDELVDGGGDAGADAATAFVPSGTGELLRIAGNVEVAGDADLYRINICDLANFSATTFGSTGDTQLFLFNTDGTGVVMNDDVPAGFPGAGSLLSRIGNSLVTADGDYIIGVARYDNDPLGPGGLPIWLDQPFGTERAPDGDEPTGAVTSFTGGGGTGTYTLVMTGVCFSGGRGNVCGAADLGSVGGVAGADNHLDNNDFVVFIDFFFAHNALADQGSTGGVPGSDGVWDNNDFVVFIDNFFNAPASCR